jgi:hypothetical protein
LLLLLERAADIRRFLHRELKTGIDAMLYGISAGVRFVIDSTTWQASEEDASLEESASEMEDIRISDLEYGDSEELGSSLGDDWTAAETEAADVTPGEPKQNGWERWFDWGTYYRASP